MDPLWPLSLSIPGWTDYDPNGGPGVLQGRANPRQPLDGRRTPASTGVPTGLFIQTGIR